MERDYVECPELSGKTIQTLRIYMDTGDGTTPHMELTDGASFICSLSHQPTVRASLLQKRLRHSSDDSRLRHLAITG
jgi:hypothetical protein